jgi:hypothetical protein
MHCKEIFHLNYFLFIKVRPAMLQNRLFDFCHTLIRTADYLQTFLGSFCNVQKLMVKEGERLGEVAGKGRGECEDQAEEEGEEEGEEGSRKRKV